MKMLIPKILTIDAEKLFSYCSYKPECECSPVCFDARNPFIYRQVVKKMDDLDECPMLHQIISSETFKKSKTDIHKSDEWLLDKLIIVDLGNIFSRNIESKSKRKEQKEGRR